MPRKVRTTETPWVVHDDGDGLWIGGGGHGPLAGGDVVCEFPGPITDTDRANARLIVAAVNALAEANRNAQGP